MNRRGKTCWKAILVQGPGNAGGDDARELDTAERLAALYRFQNGEAPSDHRFVRLGEGEVDADPSNPLCEVTEPGEIDWGTFPVVAALEAVTREELRRLRTLLRADAASAIVDEPTPPGWGLDLDRRATAREL